MILKTDEGASGPETTFPLYSLPVVWLVYVAECGQLL